MFSGYTSVRNPTLAISIDCASIKDFTLHFIRKTVYIYICILSMLCYMSILLLISLRGRIETIVMPALV
jgi:hypothetical protein